MEIKVRDGNLEKALKILKRKIGREGVLKELKNRRYYKKPSVKAKRKRAEARKKRNKSKNRRTSSFKMNGFVCLPSRAFIFDITR